MASSLVSHQNVFFQFHPFLPSLPIQSNSLNKFNPTLINSSLRCANSVKLKLKCQISRASSEELPAELIEDSKFVPLNSEDPKYGPPALLLLGFQVEEAAEIQQLLKELDGEFLKVIFCTEDMIDRSLWEAVTAEQSNLDVSKVATWLPRICFLSGLNGEEMMMFIDAFEETGLEQPVFAALVPNSAEKPLSELIEEIMGDHEMLSSKKNE
ncbi:uncharacterized protein LOC127251256 [Andrographis paniculata]|uniref:uncharacterized protein LOC127251256 n=1 Tax=Andrographis paniculata TaxID=175694 RepID=UPI0021E70938|nr:uncharacterized protein LOC127251256 [Andrographis paniculata]